MIRKIALLSILFILSLFAREVAFRFTPNIPADRVNLAGAFNGWSTDATPMVDNSGIWEVTLDLPDGEYQYKFVVNGNVWITDPNNPKSAPDGFGGQNSVITVGDWEKFVGKSARGDGEIMDGAIWHEQALPYLCDDGYGNLWIRIRVKKDDVQEVRLEYKDFQTGRLEIPMNYLCSEHPFEWFEVSIPSGKKVEYSFKIIDSEASFRTPVGEVYKFTPKEAPLFVTPKWARGVLFYQIFPERFANGDPSNDPENVVPWGSVPEYDNFMGGDLRGVISNISHLSDLSVGAIYFNPIFEAGSNHKYDTHDYLKIDDNFGDTEIFKELNKKTEAVGIKIVLDGVFNHCGFGSEIFQDVVKNGEKSKYADWFYVHSYPVRGPENPNYDAWWGFGSLPKLNTSNIEVRKYLFKAIRKWQELGADGWRLDVANEVPHEFWQAFRDTIRAIDKNAYSVGEIWGDGTPWLNGKEFDAVMNYRFRDACIEFFAWSNIKPSDFLDRLGGYVADYPQPVNAVSMNLLGSHDTPRFLTMAKGEPWRSKLAIVWMLTWPGAPCIYYGDEIGMLGEKDPDCRRAFPWDSRETWNMDIFKATRYIAGLRQKNKSLMLGTVRPLLLDDVNNVLVVERRFENEISIVAMNLSGEPQSVSVRVFGENPFAPADKKPLDKKTLGRVTEVFSGERIYDPHPLEFELPPHETKIFIFK